MYPDNKDIWQELTLQLANVGDGLAVFQITHYVFNTSDETLQYCLPTFSGHNSALRVTSMKETFQVLYWCMVHVCYQGTICYDVVCRSLVERMSIALSL